MTSFLGLDYAQPVEIVSSAIESQARALSGKIVATSSGAQRWEVLLTLEPGAYPDQTDAALAQHRAEMGITKTFDLAMPQPVPAAIAAAANQQCSAAAAGDDELTLRATNDTALSRGRFIAFAGHRKVYQVRETVSVVAAGAVVKIFPALLEDVAMDARWHPAPDLLCRYLPASGGFFGVDRRGILARSIQVIEA